MTPTTPFAVDRASASGDAAARAECCPARAAFFENANFPATPQRTTHEYGCVHTVFGKYPSSASRAPRVTADAARPLGSPAEGVEPLDVAGAIIVSLAFSTLVWLAGAGFALWWLR